MAEERQVDKDPMSIFFSNEIKNLNDSSNYIVTFNIGTYSDIDQELNDEWLIKLNDYMLDLNYTKIFYFIDIEYKNIDIENFVKNITKKIYNFYHQNKVKNITKKKYNLNYQNNIKNMVFDNKYKTNNVNVMYNSLYNILIKKIDMNLPTSYNYTDIFSEAFHNKLYLERTFSSAPILPCWTKLYKLLYHLKVLNSLIYINNYAFTNTNMFIVNGTSRPIYVKAFMGTYLEYFSELGYILRFLLNDGQTYKRLLFRIKPYEKNNITIKPIDEFNNFNCELKKNWDLI